MTPETPIFINKQLCRALKKLLGKAIAHKHEKTWKFDSVRGFKMFARNTERTRILHDDDYLEEMY